MKHAFLSAWLIALLPAMASGQTLADPTLESKEAGPSELLIKTLPKSQAAEQIGGGRDDPFFQKLYPREVAAMTGAPQPNPSVAQSREFAQSFFRNAVLDFSKQETECVRRVVVQLDQQFGERYPRLIRRPWRFIKTRRDLCGGFSFTRQDCIILSEPTLERMVASVSDPQAIRRSEELLLHEQMHVLQRERPEFFQPFYEEVCGFRKAVVRVSSWVDQRQITNPDGVDDNWVFDIPDGDTVTTYWIGTLLRGEKPVPQMGRDFNTVAVRLHAADSEAGGYTMSRSEAERPDYTSLTDMAAITSQLPLPPVYDHVHEVGAYMLTMITHGRPTQPERMSAKAAHVLEQSKQWFAQNLTTPQHQPTKAEPNEVESGT